MEIPISTKVILISNFIVQGTQPVIGSSVSLEVVVQVLFLQKQINIYDIKGAVWFALLRPPKVS